MHYCRRLAIRWEYPIENFPGFGFNSPASLLAQAFMMLEGEPPLPRGRSGSVLLKGASFADGGLTCAKNS